MSKGPISIGALLLIAGIADHAYAAPKAALCSSDIGEFGQALDPSLAKDCSTYTTLEQAVGWLIGAGIVLLAIGIIWFVIQAGIIGTELSRSRKNPGRATVKRATPGAPRTAQGPMPPAAASPSAPARQAAPSRPAHAASPSASARPAAPSGPAHAPFGTTGQPRDPNIGS
jgi:hypothetical protein